MLSGQDNIFMVIIGFIFSLSYYGLAKKEKSNLDLVLLFFWKMLDFQSQQNI